MKLLVFLSDCFFNEIQVYVEDYGGVRSFGDNKVLNLYCLQRPTVEVTGHKAHGPVPEPGSIVTARVSEIG